MSNKKEKAKPDIARDYTWLHVIVQGNIDYLYHNMCVCKRDKEKTRKRVRIVTDGLFHSQDVWTNSVIEKDQLNLAQVCKWDRDGLAGQT